MEKQLQNAVDDISLIKNVINNTRRSFSSFSRIFIGWGIMYLFFSFLNFLQGMNMDLTISIYNEFRFLVYLIPALLYLIGGYMYYRVTKQQPLVGLERHLMVLWILIITMQLMRVVIEIPMTETMGKIVVMTSNLGIMSYALGIALLMTGILTELKNFKVIGGVYIIFAFLYSYLPYYSFGKNLSVVGMLIMPLTLIYTGVYLKRQHERSNNGTELNS